MIGARHAGARRCALAATRIVCVTLVGLSCTAARAERPASAPANAGQLLERGRALFADGELARSRAVLLRAREVTDDPQLLGRIHLYLGLNLATEEDDRGARRAFRQALLHDPALTVDANRIKPEFVELFRSVKRSMEGRLRIGQQAAGLEVWLDGVRLGPAPLEHAVIAGTHAVTLRKTTGQVVQRQQVTIRAGQRVEIDRTSVTPAAERRAAPDRGGQPTHRRRVWTWVAAGATAVTLGLAVGFGIAAAGDHQQACDLLVGPGDCEQRQLVASEADLARYATLHDSFGDRKLVSNIAWGAAAALAVTSVVLYFIEGRRRADAPLQARVGGLGVGDLSLAFQLDY